MGGTIRDIGEGAGTALILSPRLVLNFSMIKMKMVLIVLFVRFIRRSLSSAQTEQASSMAGWKRPWMSQVTTRLFRCKVQSVIF